MSTQKEFWKPFLIFDSLADELWQNEPEFGSQAWFTVLLKCICGHVAVFDAVIRNKLAWAVNSFCCVRWDQKARAGFKKSGNGELRGGLCIRYHTLQMEKRSTLQHLLSLYAAMCTGSWSGKTSPSFQSKLGLACVFCVDSECNVWYVHKCEFQLTNTTQTAHVLIVFIRLFSTLYPIYLVLWKTLHYRCKSNHYNAIYTWLQPKSLLLTCVKIL